MVKQIAQLLVCALIGLPCAASAAGMLLHSQAVYYWEESRSFILCGLVAQAGAKAFVLVGIVATSKRHLQLYRTHGGMAVLRGGHGCQQRSLRHVPHNTVGYMLQKDMLQPWRTVPDNIILGMEVRRVSRPLSCGAGTMYPACNHGAATTLRPVAFVSASPQVLAAALKRNAQAHSGIEA